MTNENKPSLVQPSDYINYIKNHSDYCDDWTMEFINDIDQRIKRLMTLSQKQFFLLERKAKDIFIEKNSKSFHCDIFTNQ